MKNKKKSKENQLIMTVPKIDKISIVITIPEINFATAISQNIWDELKLTDSGWVQPYSKGSYNTAAKIFCPDENGEIKAKKGDPHMLLQVKTTGKYSPYIRIEYNPSKIPQKLYDHLNWSFLGITGQSFFETISHGRITRLDVCTDIPDANPEDFMAKAKYARHSQSLFGTDGKLKTIYFGKSKGTQYTVYKKDEEAYGEKSGLDIMRIECRLRKTVPIQQLPFLENPFERVELHNLTPTKKPKIHDGHWRAFVDSVRYRGSLNTALKHQPADVQQKLKYCLTKNKHQGWQPQHLWGKAWLQVLAEYHLLQMPKAPPLTLKVATGEEVNMPDAAQDLHHFPPKQHSKSP